MSYTLWPCTFPAIESSTAWTRRQGRLDEVWLRTIESDDVTETLEIVRYGGSWCYRLGPDDRLIKLPGARDFTVAEFVSGHVRRTQRYGEWIELGAEVAGAAEPLLTWCRRHCNSQLPAGGFRFAPATWKARSSDALPVPFIPEFDHPDQTLRVLAATERRRRTLASALTTADEVRRQQIQAAAWLVTVAGPSRHCSACPSLAYSSSFVMASTCYRPSKARAGQAYRRLDVALVARYLAVGATFL